ncbi:leucine-rich repeat serine/threonine-protein kinase 1 isoform X2 [Lepeophtheirus salmonis]
MASEYGYIENVRVLVEAGSNLSLRDALGLTALDLAEKGDHLECMAVLSRAAHVQEETRLSRLQLLHDACVSGDLQTMEEDLFQLQSSHGGSNTLVFTACEYGHIQILSFLLEKGARPTIHPVTQYSPLYIASLNGKIDIVQVLLYKFPHLILQLTVEGRSPIHAAALNGHVAVLELLLKFKYPNNLLRQIREKTGQWEFYLPFDLNQRDKVGYTCLYLATSSSNSKVVNSLLQFRVQASKRIITSPEKVDSEPSSIEKSSLKSYNSEGSVVTSSDTLISPIEVDLYCGVETSLHCAVKKKDLKIANLLLAVGADPNNVILNSELGTFNCLVEACRNRDFSMIDTLLKHSAKDDNCEALNIVLNNDVIVCKLLSHKAIQDTEDIINYKNFIVTPVCSVRIDWDNQGGQLDYIKDHWISEASLRYNPSLRLTPNYQDVSYQVITRLDLSSNKLREMPQSVLKMVNLKFLSLAANKLESLPDYDGMDNKLAKTYNCPRLEEIQLQDNRLDTLPAAIFSLESLITLDASNNKLQYLPQDIWKSPKLKELNLSFNLLNDLQIDCPLGTTDNHRCCTLDNDLCLSVLESFSNDKKVSHTSICNDMMESKELKRCNLWSQSLEICERLSKRVNSELYVKDEFSSMQVLNLAHNSFSVIPKCISCFCPSLSRLNLSYNALTNFGAICCYPSSLKYLDLSHNQINSWPSHGPNSEHKFCYKRLLSNKCLKVGSCPHRQHDKMTNLRTLILSANKLDKLQVRLGSKVFFPNLSMLDVSNNNISQISKSILELNNLSVLNLSFNPSLTDLPHQMGLLCKLWNLDTKGCNLIEPLGSMTRSKRCKTSDIVSYLRSMLENSRSYARMKLMVVGIQGIGKTTLLELLRQEGGSFRRKPVEHWAKRMGNRNMNMKKGDISLSTVGVDIGDWTFEKRGSTRGPIVFRTWDFGGQTEYYSTHQYFLSRRSLYLVVWNIVDGEKGMSEIEQWLINIQARAPNSPVIIVGTHFDVIKENPTSSYFEYLQSCIRDKFINVTDPEKSGLPKVLDCVEVSCRTRHNIKLLANLIYDVSFNLKSPGSNVRLLEQKIPATFLALEEIVNYLASDLKNRGLDPVLSQEKFEESVKLELSSKYKLSFRDLGELSQATKFLHENGLLLHYDDATLRDLYFLDPQWLCDLLSHVVTIREINPFARNGLMKLDDLKLVFKSSAAISLTAKSYVVNLLNKFEIALTWDSSTLLIPSLLPTEAQMKNGHHLIVSIPVRSRGLRGRKAFDNINSSRSHSVPSRMLLKASNISLPQRLKQRNQGRKSLSSFEVTHRSEIDHRIQRLFLMSYFPSGFWSRLLSRILADDNVVEIVRSYFVIPDDWYTDTLLSKIFMENKPEWTCWQSGLELRYLETTLFSLKQIFHESFNPFFDYHSMRMMIYQEDIWSPLDKSSSSILELSLPQDTVLIKKTIKNESKEEIGYTMSVLDLNPKSVCQLLALAVEHIDTLLEDWYPSLGTRFLHTSEGRMLITRIVPCPRCLTQFNEINNNVNQPSNVLSLDDGINHKKKHIKKVVKSNNSPPIYVFPIEECILMAFESRNPRCFIHGDLLLGQIAPDIIFLDLEDRLRISNENIKRGKLIGQGAFGFVFISTLTSRGINEQQKVAVKILQPTHPGYNAKESTSAAYEISISKWERDPIQYAAKAYCSARQEISILIHLKHPNIVPLIGVCIKPLSIILELAPKGALDKKLEYYLHSDCQIPIKVVQLIVLQISRALEYLHQLHIIYRDLKSENVLVWKFPEPFSKLSNEVHVKLADYGISRPTLPTGTKGFGGTEGFMAPEIVKYNGEEEYTEKVDCFSFGMFIYELITLHQPFSGYETIKELLLEGIRPPISVKETKFPTNILDLMISCWSQQPRHRPSTSQLVSIISAPEFINLIDAISIGTTSTSAQIVTPRKEVWLSIDSAFDQHSSLNLLEFSHEKWIQHCIFKTKFTQSITALCLIEEAVWAGDNIGLIHSYSLNNYSKLFTYKMDPDYGNEPSPVRSIHYLQEMQRACIALHNGRMFLCDSNIIPSCKVGGEGFFVMTELGSSSCIHSIASINLNPRSWEIWCGESHGSVSIFSFIDGVVTSQQIINHNNPIVENLLVLQVLTEGTYIWTSLYPGFHVYQWNTTTKSVINRLDCSKLIPVSESLRTISIEECFNPGRCQITSINLLESKLYVGTNWGCVIIAESINMQPITVFRPYSDQVQAIIPIPEHGLLVTLGKGYRPLIPRYASGCEENDSEDENNNMFALLWTANGWLMNN